MSNNKPGRGFAGMLSTLGVILTVLLVARNFIFIPSLLGVPAGVVFVWMAPFITMMLCLFLIRCYKTMFARPAGVVIMALSILQLVVSLLPPNYSLWGIWGVLGALVFAGAGWLVFTSNVVKANASK